MIETQPSAEWTHEERLAVIAELSVALRAESNGGLVPRARVYDVSERVAFIATMSSKFLEDNRALILKN